MKLNETQKQLKTKYNKTTITTNDKEQPGIFINALNQFKMLLLT